MSDVDVTVRLKWTVQQYKRDQYHGIIQSFQMYFNRHFCIPFKFIRPRIHYPDGSIESDLFGVSFMSILKEDEETLDSQYHEACMAHQYTSSLRP